MASFAKSVVNAYRRLCGTFGLAAEVGQIRESVDALSRRLDGIGTDKQQLDALNASLQEANKKLTADAVLRELYQRDLLLVLDKVAKFIPRGRFALETEHPLAINSLDHLHPFGTAMDNTRHPRFVRACEEVMNLSRPLNFMDLGCAGGGLVLDFTLQGHNAIGLEGSNYSLLNQRAEWRILKDSLFTCDITKPYLVRDSLTGERAQFDIITAWEVPEHIGKEDHPMFFSSIRDHLADGGLFIGSIGTFTSTSKDNPDIDYHLTNENKDWWDAAFRKHGFEFVKDPGFRHRDYCRGVEDGLGSGDYAEHPDWGFHFVAKKNG